MLPAIRRFLADIGLDTQKAVLPAATFLPGLRIDQGCLLTNPARLLYVGDVLHAASHPALGPRRRPRRPLPRMTRWLRE